MYGGNNQKGVKDLNLDEYLKINIQEIGEKRIKKIKKSKNNVSLAFSCPEFINYF